MFDDSVFFLCPNTLSANKQILNSHITWCPKITVLQNPRVPSKHETLAHRLRRWPNISPALGQRIVFAGLVC